MTTLALHSPAAAQLDHPSLTGRVSDHTVARGETLRSIGARYGVDPGTIAADNGIELQEILPAGRVLRIDHRHLVPGALAVGEVVVNVPQRMLFYRRASGVLAFPAAVGRRDWRTPLGEFSIVAKERDPAWHVPPSIRAEARRSGTELPAVVPPGPSNPLGRYWLGLDIGGVGIHGTNAPASVYQAVTHGCVRLHPDDIAALYGYVAVGTRGRIVYEPYLLVAVGETVFLEAHRDEYGLGPDPLPIVRERAAEAGVSDRIDWDAVARLLRARDGVARVVSSSASSAAPGPLREGNARPPSAAGAGALTYAADDRGKCRT